MVKRIESGGSPDGVASFDNISEPADAPPAELATLAAGINPELDLDELPGQDVIIAEDEPGAEPLAAIEPATEDDSEPADTEDEGVEDDKIFDTGTSIDLDEPPGSVDDVRLYLRAIGRVACLNAEEEVELAKQIEAGLYASRIITARLETVETDRRAAVGLGATALDDTVPLSELFRLERQGAAAKERMIEANLRLVVNLAKRYTGRGLAFLDVIQEGNLGLMRAVEKFDYTKGFKFSTYATWWIRQGITRALAEQARTIRIPVHMVEAINKMENKRRELWQQLGREPTPAELARELDIDPDKVIEIQEFAALLPLSLDKARDDEDDRTAHDTVATNQPTQLDIAVQGLRAAELKEVLLTLPSRDRRIIELRYGLTDGVPRTLDQIGKIFGVTRERIRQIVTQTMDRLRHPSRSQTLREYLD